MPYALTRPISEDDCLGDSLDQPITSTKGGVNTNYLALDEAVQSLSASFTTAFFCERNGAGTANDVMSYGAGSTGGRGLRMPYNGQLIRATLQATNMTGTIAVDPIINNIPNVFYRLTTTGTSLTGGTTSSYTTPLNFNANDTLGWRQTTVPSSANNYNVTYVVKFNL